MNRLSTADRARVVSALMKGNSLRATAHLTGVARMTVEKLLRDLGVACAAYHDSHVSDLSSKRVQCDEIWSFCYGKAKNVPAKLAAVAVPGTIADVWTWTAIDAESKLIVSYLIGDRSARTAQVFLDDLAWRIKGRVQLTTDGLRAYLSAVDFAFEGREIDYAILEKLYAADGQQGRYSPAKVLSSKRSAVKGTPNPRHISTSYVERQNFTMLMNMRRFTRLTNGFSKKIDNHIHAVALHFMYYNFCRVHQTLRVTPAMEAKLSDHVWTLDELVALLG